MDAVNKYEAVMDFLNIHRESPVISLEEVNELIDKIRDVKDLERLSSSEPDKLDVYFKNVITRRLCHCAINLLSKYQNGTKTPSGKYVMFNDNTHFSKPVYENMLDALKVRHEKWNPLIWQQVVRQMYYEHSADNNEFDIATEYLLVTER